jgi:hypothetical protein
MVIKARGAVLLPDSHRGVAMSCARASDGSRARICAILTPSSPSAEYSAGLEENRAKINHVPQYRSLPSPSTSDSEAESGILPPCRRPRTKTSTRNTRPWRERSAGHAVIVLKQSHNDEKFIFGSSQRTGNEVLLKHQHPEKPACCWVNSIHLELYPHPDHGVLVLYNRSTSEFTTQSSLESAADKIPSGRSARLARGTWRLTLGGGFAFHVEVLLCGVGEPYHGGLRLSRAEPALCVKGSKTNAADTPCHNAMIVTKSAHIESTHKVQARSGPPGEPRSGETSSAETLKLAVTSSPEGSIIGLTSHTEVRKVNRKGTIVAMKLCRRPDLKKSADMWRNELDILSPLDHVRQPIKIISIELTSPAVCGETA